MILAVLIILRAFDLVPITWAGAVVFGVVADLFYIFVKRSLK